MSRLGCLALLVAGLAACASWPLLGADEPDTAQPTLVFDPPAELPAPEDVRATSGEYREIPLQWDPVLLPGVAGYLVESGPSAEGPFVSRATAPDRGVLAWVDRDEATSPLGDGEARYYRLRAFAHDGRVSGLVSLVAAASTAPLPAPPENLRVYSLQPRSIPLVWNASTDPIAAGYVVERSPGPDGPFEVVAELEGRHTTHLLDAGLGDLRVFHYRVSSRNPGGERGPPSEVRRAVTKPPPLPPIGLRVEERRLGVIALAWEQNVESDLLMYRLLRWRAGEKPETVTFVGAWETRAEDADVGAREVWSYALVAVDRDGLESRLSRELWAEGLGYEWAATASAGGVRLRWNPRREEGFVRARITRLGRLWQTESRVVEGAELLDRDVSPGRRYRYEIVLEHADGHEAPNSQPLWVDVPEPGEPFVEIQPPASRLPPPEGIPR